MDRKKDIRHEVYTALAKVMKQTGASQYDLELALEWFVTHYFEVEEGER